MVPIQVYLKSCIAEAKADPFTAFVACFISAAVSYTIVIISPIVMWLVISAMCGGYLYWYLEAGFYPKDKDGPHH